MAGAGERCLLRNFCKGPVPPFEIRCFASCCGFALHLAGEARWYPDHGARKWTFREHSLDTPVPLPLFSSHSFCSKQCAMIWEACFCKATSIEAATTTEFGILSFVFD